MRCSVFFRFWSVGSNRMNCWLLLFRCTLSKSWSFLDGEIWLPLRSDKTWGPSLNYGSWNRLFKDETNRGRTDYCVLTWTNLLSIQDAHCKILYTDDQLFTSVESVILWERWQCGGRSGICDSKVHGDEQIVCAVTHQVRSSLFFGSFQNVGSGAWMRG